jgi:hypothetical protein
MEQEISPKQALKGPLVLLGEAWKVFIAYPTTYLKLTLLSILVFFVSAIALFIFGAILFALSRSWPLSIGVPLIVGVPILIYLQSWMVLGMFNGLLKNAENKNSGVGVVLSEVKPFIIPYFLTTLLNGLIVFGGFLLLFVPGVILSIYFSLYIYVLLKEGKVGLQALLTSREYLRGYAAIVFIYMLIIWGILYAASIIPQYIFRQMDMPFLGTIYNLIFSFIMTPLGILFSIKLYDELKRIKGTVEISNFNQRKVKYVALAVFGVLAPILFILFVSTTAASLFSSYY